MRNTYIAGMLAGVACFTPAIAGEAGAIFHPSVVTVHIKNFMFRPSVVRVHAGDRVTFVNDDDEAHTVTSETMSFDSAGLDRGDNWQHVFAASGVVHYTCELHPYMKATIVVLPATSRSLQKGTL